MNNEDYHKILGSVSFKFPNMKPPDGSAPPTVPAVVIYTPDLGNYLTGAEIELYTDQLNPPSNNSPPPKELAIQVAVLVGPNGIVYHKIAMDHIRNETHNTPITIKGADGFILTKRVLPYEETFDPTNLSGGTQNTPPPHPVLRSGTCDYNYVADANVVFDHNNQETWLSSFGEYMKIGRNLLAGIFNYYPEYGNFNSDYGFVNINSAGWATRNTDPTTAGHKGVRSHFYKAEASLNSVPLELYRLELQKIKIWKLNRPELVDKYGGDTHYALAYQFNRKGSYYRQGLDGNQWDPSNTDPGDHAKYTTILADLNNPDGNLLPYTSRDDFEDALAVENFYDINLSRTLHTFSTGTFARPAMAGNGTAVTAIFDIMSYFTFYKYNIYVKSPIYREFMTGGRLGLYANFTDNFKIYKSLNPLYDDELNGDCHTVYEGEQIPVEHTTAGSDNNPSPVGTNFLKSLKYFENYRLAGGDYLGFAAFGNVEWGGEKMTHYPHTGFLPSLTFDVKWCSAADSKITYPIVDGESTNPAVTPPEASVPDLVTTLLTNQVLQSTYSHNLVMTTSRDTIDIDPNNSLPCNLYKNINFFPISENVGIYNIPQKDSATGIPNIGSKLSNGSGTFDKYIYSCAVDGPVISTFSTPPQSPSLKGSPPSPPPETRKILICLGSDLRIKMVDHAKICNRCYNMVATTVCTASSMPSPILFDITKLNSRDKMPSNMAFAMVSNRNVIVKFGESPPNPRNFYLDTFIKSTGTGSNPHQGGFMNLPVIENTNFDPNWKEATGPWAIFRVTPTIPIPDTRNVTAFRPWRDKIAYGFHGVYGFGGLVRSTIFDYAWNLSVDNGSNGLPTTAISTRNMKIRQGEIQDKGFIDMVGNVPVNTLNRRVMEAGLVHGGLYAKLSTSYVDILDQSIASVPTMTGFMGSSISLAPTLMLNTQMAFNKSDYVHGLVAAILYNHTAGEIGVALGSGCSNISIYADIAEIDADWGKLPPVIYNYYGYGATPHYIGLHPDGFYWIPTDIGYYIHKDPDVVLDPVTKFAEEQEHEWCQPLLRTGFINTNVAPYYPTLPELITTITKIPALLGQIKVKFSGSHILPHTGSKWDCVPKVPASKIYQDTLFTVTGSYGQVTNGDSAYWQYVENFLIRDLTNETDLKTFNENN